jgi:SPP1 family predicted phage head-tail adaptor
VFDQVLSFQAEIRTDDLHGGASVLWETQFKARANVQAIQGAELLRAQGLEQITSHRIRIRNHRIMPVDVSMRIVWETNDGKILNIISCPDPGPRATTRELIAQEGGAV